MVRQILKAIVIILCVVAIALHLIVAYSSQIADVGDKALKNSWTALSLFTSLFYLHLVVFGLLKYRYGKFVLYISYLSFLFIFILYLISYIGGRESNFLLFRAFYISGTTSMVFALVTYFLLPLSHFLLFGRNTKEVTQVKEN